MDDVKKAYAWQEALELSKQLVRICEEFSDAATNVLVWHLRQAVVDIPGGIAADLQADRPATMEPMVRLATELELVRKIYPAIETGDVEERLERLMERMQSERFTEREPEPESDADEADDAGVATEVTEAAPGASALEGPRVDGVQQPTREA